MNRPNRKDYTKTYGTTLGEVYESTNLCEYTPALEKYCDELEKQVEDYSTKAGTYKFKLDKYEKALDKACIALEAKDKWLNWWDESCKITSPKQWKEWCLKDESN